MGSLEGDVQNWAMLIQNYILQVSFVKLYHCVQLDYHSFFKSISKSADHIKQFIIMKCVLEKDLLSLLPYFSKILSLLFCGRALE